MFPHNFTKLFLLFTFFTPSLTLFIYTFSTNSTPHNESYSCTSLPSFYATLGNQPSQTIKSNLTLLSSSQIDQHQCSLLPGINISGKIVIFKEDKLPHLQGCNHDHRGSLSSLARLIQRNGGIGFIALSFDSVRIHHF